jgi:hypothetical protein
MVQVKTITSLTLAALAEAASPYGIESFDDVLEPLWRGIRSLRGKVLAAFLKCIGFIIPLMDAEHAFYYTREVMVVLKREFQTPDEEMKKIVLKVSFGFHAAGFHCWGAFRNFSRVPQAACCLCPDPYNRWGVVAGAALKHVFPAQQWMSCAEEMLLDGGLVASALLLSAAGGAAVCGNRGGGAGVHQDRGPARVLSLLLAAPHGLG